MDANAEGSDECEEEMSVRMGRAQYASVCSTRLVLSDGPDLSFEAISSLPLHMFFPTHHVISLPQKPANNNDHNTHSNARTRDKTHI
jgi:hypothetical protein